MAKLNVPSHRTTIHDISDDLLEVVLLHIPSTAGVIRAAATCKLWRRVIGDAGFRRRFRRLNGPHILGHYYYYERSGTEFLPFPATPPAWQIAVDDIGARVSLYFLTTSYANLNYAELHDSRCGLLALYHFGFGIIVCNPWTRQDRQIYLPMPMVNTSMHYLGIFLLDADPDDETGTDMNMSNFRVLCVRLIHYHHDGSKIVEASVFSARNDRRWLLLSNMAICDVIPGRGVFGSRFVLVGRAGGSICWSTKSSNVVLHLDEGTGEFSLFTLPVNAGVDINLLSYNRMELRVIGGDVGTVHLVRIVGGDIEVLRYARRGACVVERRVRVPQAASTEDDRRELRRVWCFFDRAEAASPGSIALCDVLCDAEFVRKFSAVQNLKLERVKWRKDGGRTFPYELPWTISACL
uniref:F-box domain-containing protein n=1 Tax=Setaria viridis TaxID=4556 RepID=A0A4U6VI00_SETVI|nr:hypothetical protein SEVIR_3G383400v2 [Setaria viridis]